MHFAVSRLLKLSKQTFYFPARYFLSEAFNCNQTWENRLNAPVLKKINIEALYYDMDDKFNKTKKLNPLDVDLFVNYLTDDTYIAEAEELVHRLRLTSETHNTLPTTYEAIIRLFLSSNKIEDIVRILHDRLNYGIFPNNYSLLYLMNKFITSQDYKNAAKIASLEMFQEDYSHLLVKYFSLYSIHKYLLNPTPWENIKMEKTEEVEDDDEEIRIRVDYLRNPFFDDHFDLVDGNHICGKSLAMIGSKIDDTLGRSYSIMGLALYNKWDKLDKYLNHLLQLNVDKLVYEDSVVFVENVLSSNTSIEEDKLNSIKNSLGKIISCDNIKTSLIYTLEEKLKELVNIHEKNLIQKQEKLFVKWEKLRENKLNDYIDAMNKSKRLAEVQKKRTELEQKEQLLYYFENERKIDLIVENKTNKLKAQLKVKRKDDPTVIEIYEPPDVEPKGFHRREP